MWCRSCVPALPRIGFFRGKSTALVEILVDDNNHYDSDCSPTTLFLSNTIPWTPTEDHEEDDEDMVVMERIPQHEGVLYKRRDFYTSYWRPRWFVLQDGMLTYYLLSSAMHEEYPTISTKSSSPSTAARRRRSQTSSTQSSLSAAVDYDVVPRGNILLPQGCHVQAEVGMSQEGLLVFSIVAPSSSNGENLTSSSGGGESPCYLAAATAEARDAWMDHIKRICHPDDPVVQRPLPALGDWKDEQGVDDLPLSGVPNQLRDRIRSVLKEHLPYATPINNIRHEDDDSNDWSLSFENKDGVTSYQRNYGQNGGIMIKSEAILDHHPKQLANLLLDFRRRKHFETNLRYDERLKVYNSHTFLDYYAYHPVWPTSARDFLVAVHWRVLKRGENETALCMLGFSYPEENALRPPPSGHVRAHLNVTLSLLEAVIDDDGNTKSRFTRIVSYDLCGSLPSSISNTILQQQATLPRVLTTFLKQTEPSPPNRLTSGDLSTESIIKDIMDYLPEDGDDDDDGSQVDRVRRRLRFTDSSQGDSSMADDVSTVEGARASTRSDMKEDEEEPSSRMSVLVSAIILLTPLLLWRLVLLLSDSNTAESSVPVKELVFCTTAYYTVRLVVLDHLGNVQPPRAPSGGTTIVVRVPVNLRGVLRLLAAKRRREEEDEVKSSTIVSVSHVAARAIAKALREKKSLHFEWVRFMNGWRRPTCLHLAMTDVALPASSTINGILPLSPLMTLGEVARELKKKKHNDAAAVRKSIPVTVLEMLHLSATPSTTHCYLYTNSERGSELEVDVTPPEDAALVVVLGGVRITKTLSQRGNISATSSRTAISKPTMLVTMSFNASAWSVSDSRNFASRVKQLIEQPEDD